MRRKLWNGFVSALTAAVLGLGILGAPVDAFALGVALPFDIELGPQRTGDFGTLQIEEVAGGALRFTIVLNTAVLGSRADLNEFYFNLSEDGDDDRDDHHGRARGDWDDDDRKKNGRWKSDWDGDDWKHRGRHDDDWDDDDGDDDDLSISNFLCNGQACRTPFELDDDEPTRGGAGARFDFSVDFGDGSGKKGNDILQIVSFLLSADGGLSLADVLSEASSTGRGLDVLFAAHVTGSGNGNGSGSATIGVVVPEPTTALLLALGVSGLAIAVRRSSGRL
jgi:hypothetical protein